MSYARFGDESDVYVYHDVGGYLCCCACALRDGRSFTTDSRQGMLNHLEQHWERKHDVPPYVAEELRSEIGEIGDHVSGEESPKKPAPEDF